MMANNEKLFYPILNRRKQYKLTQQETYYQNYNKYRDEIGEDCQERCVYCDMALDEMGGDGMQLDHFRSQNIKEFKYLVNDPNNLVLSCQKCNRLKSDHWPANISISETYTDGCGFIDPFTEDRGEYFEIIDTGQIEEKQPPAKYVINLLMLNRMAKVQLRRKRLIKIKCKHVTDIITKRIIQFIELFKNGISKEEGSEKLDEILELLAMQKQLLLFL